jgi:hypothetical protein
MVANFSCYDSQSVDNRVVVRVVSIGMVLVAALTPLNEPPGPDLACQLLSIAPWLRISLATTLN